MRSNLEAIERAHRQVSSGLRVERPSDDPTATEAVVRTSSGLRALEQYQRNITRGVSRLGAEEGVLEQVGDVLSRARELAVGQAGATANAETRGVAAAEVHELVEHVRDLANTTMGGSYVFGGVHAGVQPFPAGGPDPSRLPQGEREIEIGEGSTTPTSHSGKTVFMDTGVFDALEALETALSGGVGADVGAAIADLDTAFDGVQEVTAEVGARMRRLEVAATNLEALDANYRTFRSGLQDAEIEEAVTELVNRQTGYEAALMANARILQTTLTDYLR